MQRYNPYVSSLSAATAELTSPKSQSYYVNRAQQDLQTAFVLVVQFGCIAFALGQSCRQWVDEMEQSAQAIQPVAPGALVLATPTALVAPMIPVRVEVIASVEPLAITGYQPIALLNPAQKAKRNRKPATPKGSKAKTKIPKADALMGERDRWMPAPRKAPTTVRSSAGALIPID
jgi:hypothetical protein